MTIIVEVFLTPSVLTCQSGPPECQHTYIGSCACFGYGPFSPPPHNLWAFVVCCLFVDGNMGGQKTIESGDYALALLSATKTATSARSTMNNSASGMYFGMTTMLVVSF